MRKFFKALGIGLIVIVLLALLGGLYIKNFLPRVSKAPEMHVALSPDKIERGRYLANTVCVCMDCHSTRDWSRFSGPMIDSTLGKGGDMFDKRAGFPGTFYAKNITPFGITRYTDGELFRLITTGVTKEGRAMFPLMPFRHYGQMDTSDITSIIAYLRTLPSNPNIVPMSEADFPVSLLINLMPKKAVPVTRPDTTDKLAYGKYMVNAAGCVECHTPDKRGEIIAAEAFSGGREFQLPGGGRVRSFNLTSDKQTGLGNWSEEMFIGKFHDKRSLPQPLVQKNSFNSVMPWTMYARMKDSDLSAIYAYLKTLPPKNKIVTKFIPD